MEPYSGTSKHYFSVQYDPTCAEKLSDNFNLVPNWPIMYPNLPYPGHSRALVTQELSRTKGVGLVIMNKYILLYNHWFVVFHRFQFSNYLLFNKSISSIESSVQKETSQEMKKETNNSVKLENCQSSTVSGHHFAILHLF